MVYVGDWGSRMKHRMMQILGVWVRSLPILGVVVIEELGSGGCLRI